MKATEAQIKERLPVWEALSEFFLDTELQPDDHQRIARILAATRFSESEIEDILVCEVCPICRRNLLSPAGEWVGFDQEWLKKEIAPRFGKILKLKFLFKLVNGWMYERHRNKVRKLTEEERTK